MRRPPGFSRAASILVGAIILLILAGRSYQVISWYLGASRSPEAGKLVDIGDGTRLQLYCTGKGSPTVVFESGLGDILEEWRHVQPEVSLFARVCSYDRAGYGNSDAGLFPRTSDRIAGELHMLLQRAEGRPPYVLVGHSAGGNHVRVFHGRYPSEVAAMVLVEATQEDQYKLLPPAWTAFSAAMLDRYRGQARWAPLDVTFGIKRLTLSMQGIQVSYLLLQTKYFRARASELETVQVSAEQARAAGTLGTKPLIVLTGAKNVDATPGASQQDFDEWQRIWVNDLQPRLATLSTRGKWIVLPDSGHDVPADRPDAIVNAIREVSSAAREK